jgi:hypothetical protein
MDELTIFGGSGFVGSNFAKLYPQKSIIMPRDENWSENMKDVLYLISTTHNYHVFDDLHKDINTNLNKLMDVLPNVQGTFNFVSSWFVYGEGSQKKPQRILQSHFAVHSIEIIEYYVCAM